jgi:hypothetical protein
MVYVWTEICGMVVLLIGILASKYIFLHVHIPNLKHLSIPHLHRQKHHHECRQPNTTRPQPQNTRALTRKQLCTGIWGYDTCDSAQARQHTAYTPAVSCVEKFGCRCVEYGIEILPNSLVSDIHAMKFWKLTVCIIYSNAFNPTYPAVVLTCVYMAIARP